MTLCDAGPLVALIDRNEAMHDTCRQALTKLVSPLVTTWPCFTETMYLLHKAGGHSAQEQLWAFVESGLVRIHLSTDDETQAIRELMRQYSDTPMDLADASLVAAAEALGIRRIFTRDSHFHAYRITGSEAFEVVPAASR